MTYCDQVKSSVMRTFNLSHLYLEIDDEILLWEYKIQFKTYDLKHSNTYTYKNHLCKLSKKEAGVNN